MNSRGKKEKKIKTGLVIPTKTKTKNQHYVVALNTFMHYNKDLPQMVASRHSKTNRF